MTPTNEQIFAEAIRRQKERGGGAVTDFIIEVTREGWTPHEPVDPDLLAYQEWASERWPSDARNIRMGNTDHDGAATYFLAGARMAREQERERAKVLLRGLEDIVDADQDEISHMAFNALAKYRGEA